VEQQIVACVDMCRCLGNHHEVIHVTTGSAEEKASGDLANASRVSRRTCASNRFAQLGQLCQI
jgi:hypothetical protein